MNKYWIPIAETVCIPAPGKSLLDICSHSKDLNVSYSDDKYFKYNYSLHHLPTDYVCDDGQSRHSFKHIYSVGDKDYGTFAVEEWSILQEQLMSIEDIKSTWPDADIQFDETGHPIITNPKENSNE